MYKNISLDKECIKENDNITITYKGKLTKNPNDIYLKYITPDSNEFKEVKMEKMDNNYQATLHIPQGIENIKLAFRDELGKVDNNRQKLFTYQVEPISLAEEIDKNKKTLNEEFFLNDFLLAYNLDEEINFNTTKEELDKMDENKETLTKLSPEYLGLKDKELEKIDFSGTKKEIENSPYKMDIKLNNFEEKDVTKFVDKNLENNFTALFEDIKNESQYDVKLKTEVRYFSKLPYVKLFREAQQEALNILLENKEKETEKVVEMQPVKYVSDVSIINLMKMEANRKWAILQAKKNGSLEFSLVPQYDEMEIYSEVGLFENIKNYINAIVSSFKKLINIIQEDLNVSSVDE